MRDQRSKRAESGERKPDDNNELQDASCPAAAIVWEYTRKAKEGRRN
jgi:hypothetical protein